MGCGGAGMSPLFHLTLFVILPAVLYLTIHTYDRSR